MRQRSRHSAVALFLSLALTVAPLAADEVKLTITTLVPEGGVFLTPPWIGFHDGTFDTYDSGAPASAALERLAEDGDTGPLSDDFTVAQPGGVQATLVGPGGPLFAGDSVSMIFDLDSDLHRYFSYVSMVIPSNDAFVANGSPLVHRVYDSDGNFIPVEFYVWGREVLDAGTEVNDEAEDSTAALGQSAPDTGTVEGGVIAPHPGFNEGGRVLDARPNGDFTAPGYRLAKVTIEPAERTKVHFYGSGDQEVPPVETTATAACWARLNSDQSRITVSCEHDVEDVFAAHVHLGGVGELGDVVFPFDSAASPLYQTFDATEEGVVDLLAGDLYVNIHSDTHPTGEVRAQIEGCFAGPYSLCLQGDRFQVSADWWTSEDAGVARALPSTPAAGQFTFFDGANVELDVKVLDGCAENGYFWVYAAGLTDVGVDLLVTDTYTGAERTYSNDLGSAFEPIRDTAAFATCP